MTQVAVFAVLTALLLGFLAGLLCFKIKLRWCRECGATLQCLECRATKRQQQVRAAA